MGRLSRTIVAVVIALLALSVAAVAIAAGSPFTPTLGAPNGKRVHSGAITLKVKAPDARNVYVWVRPTRVLKKGALVECTQSEHGCAVNSMKPWKGHKGWWEYKAPVYSFAGYWATTPRGYYWQAQSFAKSPPCSFATGSCTFLTKIGHFTVGG